MNVRAIGCGLLMWAATGGLGANERLAIKVSPSVSFAPANLNVQATVETDAGNRAVQIVAESDTFYRSSEIPLDGERGPRTTRLQFRSLPPGTYQVSATVVDAEGHPRGTVHREVEVVSGSEDR